MARRRTLSYRVVLEKNRLGYHVYCPDLPGCHSEGRTLRAALANIQDAIRTYLHMVELESREGRRYEFQVAV